MKRIVTFFVDNLLIVNVMLATLIIVGIIIGENIRKESYPDITFNIVQISTVSDGASIRDMELLVTKPIEDELRSVSGIEKFESYSRAGVSYINVWLNVWGVEKYATLQEIREAVAIATREFPDNTEPTVIREIRANDTPVIRYQIRSSSISDLQMRDLAKNFQEILEGVTGVAQVDLSGYRDREIQINFNNKAMLAQSISLIDLQTAIHNYVVRESGGNLVGPTINRNIQILTDFERVEDINNINIRRSFNVKGVNVRDIATVRDDLEDQNFYVRGNLEPGITVSVYKEDSQDNFKVLARVQKVVAEFQRVVEARYNKTPMDKKQLLEQIQSSPLALGFGKVLTDKVLGKYGYDVHIQAFKDATQETKNLLKITRNNAYMGFILVFITLWIFLEFRIAFWTAFSIPLVIILTLVVFYFLGYSVNNIMLFGMITVLGILVDDGIVVAENIYRLRSLGYSGREAAVEGVMQLVVPLMGTVITTIFAFLPLLLVKKIDFLFIQQMPLVIIVTLVMSLVEVFLSLPAHIAHAKEMKKDRRPRWGERFMSSVKKGYILLLRYLMPFRYLLVIGFILFVFLSWFLAQKMQFVYYSNEENDEVNIQMRAEDGTNLEEMNHKVAFVEKAIMKEFGPLGNPIEAMFTTVGSGNLAPTDSSPTNANAATIRLLLRPFSERKITASQMVQDLEGTLKNKPEFLNWLNFPYTRESQQVQNFIRTPSYGNFVDLYKIFLQFKNPGSRVRFGYEHWLRDYKKRPYLVTNADSYGVFRDEIRDHIRMNSGFTVLNVSEPRFGPRQSNPIELIITGNDDSVRDGATQELYNFLLGINGVFGIQERRNDEGKNFFLNMNVRRMEQLGVTPSNVASSVRAAFLGAQVGSIAAADESIAMDVILSKKNRGTVSQLEDIPIPTRYRTVIPLKNISHLEMHQDSTVVMRVNGRRASSLMADVDVKRIDTRRVGVLLDQYIPGLLIKYPGVGVEQRGELGDTQETEKEAFLVFLVGLVGIFFTLLFTFRSLSQPLIILAVLPFGVVGVIISFVLHHQAMSFFGVVGVIGLMGVIINDAIVMIDNINRLVKEENRDTSFIEAVCQGSAGRIRAILLTTFTTVIGLLPAVYGWGGGVSVLRPLAMALAYGLIFGMSITLLLVPSFYIIDRDIKKTLSIIREFLVGLWIRMTKRKI